MAARRASHRRRRKSRHNCLPGLHGHGWWSGVDSVDDKECELADSPLEAMAGDLGGALGGGVGGGGGGGQWGRVSGLGWGGPQLRSE